MKATSRYSVLDRPSAGPQARELAGGDDAMLLRRETPDPAEGRLVVRAHHRVVKSPIGEIRPSAELADVDHAPLVGADADRPVAFGHLDIEAQLAAVDTSRRPSDLQLDPPAPPRRA